MAIPHVKLANNITMPQLGFGVWQVPDDEVGAAVATAFEAGYRSIDTAKAYNNERGVGAAIKDSGIDRSELFITTKLWNEDRGYESTLKAFEASMERLGLDYLDLYLIHWPGQETQAYVDTWRAFEELYQQQKVRSIGVSNFQTHHLDELAKHQTVAPMVNQIELHPMLIQTELAAYCRDHAIQVESWSPIMQGGELLHNDVIGAIAETHGKTPAQVILRWHLQQGFVAIPKSVTPERIRENADLFDFELAADEMQQISALDAGHRSGPDPDSF